MAKIKGSLVPFPSNMREAGDAAGGLRKYNVVIITAGPGNPADKHIYSQACINGSAPAFEGAQCYLNHPDAIEEQTLPERSVKDLCGYFSNVHPEGNALVAVLTLVNGPIGDLAASLIDASLTYSQEHPGQNLAGISINADGPEIPVTFQGQQWLQVDHIDSATSADIVTRPARGGEFLNRIMESYRVFKEATSSAASIKDMVTELRDKIIALMGSQDNPGLKDLRRLADNALTMIGSGNQPTETNKENTKMAQTVESRKKAAEAEAKAAEAKMAHKQASEAHAKLAEHFKAKAAEAEANGNASDVAMHNMDAEKHSKLAAEASKLAGESEGDVTVQTKKDGTATVTHKAGAEPPTADGQPTVAPAVDGDGDPANDGDEEESKKTMESLRKELSEVKAKLSESYLTTKLQESGLPEFYHASIREAVSGKSDAEIDKAVSARQSEYRATLTSLRESGPTGTRVSAPSNSDDLRKLLRIS